MVGKFDPDERSTESFNPHLLYICKLEFLAIMTVGVDTTAFVPQIIDISKLFIYFSLRPCLDPDVRASNQLIMESYPLMRTIVVRLRIRRTPISLSHFDSIYPESPHPRVNYLIDSRATSTRKPT